MNIRSLFLVLAAATLITSCHKDNKDNATNDLIGTWTTSSTTVDALVGGKTISQFFTDLGYTATDAQTYSALFNSTVQQAFIGNITFKSDQTYNTNFGGRNDSGTWALSQDGKQVTITSTANTGSGTSQPLVLNIESLTKNQLIVTWSESDTADINGDNIPENITVKLRMTLTK